MRVPVHEVPEQEKLSHSDECQHRGRQSRCCDRAEGVGGSAPCPGSEYTGVFSLFKFVSLAPMISVIYLNQKILFFLKSLPAPGSQREQRLSRQG